MKFSLSWLKDHLDTDASLETIIAKLVDLGIEVESVEDPAAKYQGIILARIESFTQHPNADRLNYCDVNTGGQILKVVCGASNVRQGMYVALAQPGVVIPVTGEPLKLSKIRGVESQGMLCSSDELLMNNTTGEDGILDIQTDKPLGTPIAEVFNLNDAVIDVSITPNRGDLFSVHGIARDLSAAGIGVLKSDDPIKHPQVPTEPVKIETNLCHSFNILRIRGLTNKPSPDWMQQRLRVAGIKTHNMLVDITNYMAIDQGQPMHAYDANKIGAISLTVRMAKDNETLICLNDEKIELNDNDIVIASDHILALAGIMGGLDSGVDENTTEILLEAALFNPVAVALSGQHHNLLSESRTRFERGVAQGLAAETIYKAAKYITDVCGGEAVSEFTYDLPQDVHNIVFDVESYTKKTGLKKTVPSMVNILERLGMTCTIIDQQTIKIKPPAWRYDIAIPEDIIEELLRIDGYGRIESLSLPLKPVVIKQSPDLKKICTHNGLLECYTWSFIGKDVFEQFSNDRMIEIANPIAQNMAVMRPSLVPGLLDVARYNKRRGQSSVALFEQAHIYKTSGAEGTTEETQVIAGCRYGQAEQRRWYKQQRDYDIFDVKNDGLLILEALGISKMQTTRTTPGYYHPERSGCWQQGKNILGYFGELHPTICESFGLSRVCAFEIFIDACPASKKKKSKHLELSPYPTIKRDLSFVVGNAVRADALMDAFAVDPRIEDVLVFDVYKMNETHRALAVEFSVVSMTHTLTDEEIQGLMDKIIANVGKKCGGVLRLAYEKETA